MEQKGKEMFPRNIKLDDVEINYPKLSTAVKDNFGNIRYEMQIVAKDAKQAEEWKKAHLSVREKDGVFSVNLKRDESRRDGTPNGAPRVVNGDLSALDPLIIGNGSRGNVILRQYEYEFGGRKGIGTMLEAVQVTSLEVYERAPTVDFEAVVSEESVSRLLTNHCSNNNHGEPRAPHPLRWKTFSYRLRHRNHIKATPRW